MTTFHDILQRYASAHCESGTDKTTSHSYGELYSELFAPIRTSAKRVLEIGVYSGASVAALADYFEGAEVEGIDLTLDNIRFGMGNPRVHFYLGDGTNPSVAYGVRGLRPPPYDLILDDGSHRLQDQMAVLKTWAPHLSRDGMIVIEDIAVPSDVSVAQLRGAFESAASREGLALTGWHDRRCIKNQFDDVVAVFGFVSCL
jgi:cephalosporin hydroxylase